MSKRLLMIPPHLAPLTGNSDAGAAVRDLARALRQWRWEVAVVLPVSADIQPDRLGLARRLQPLELGSGASLVVYEGTLESGDMRLFAIAPKTAEPLSAAACVEAALLLDIPADALMFWEGTSEGLAVPYPGSPKRILQIWSGKAVASMKHADLVLVPSADLCRPKEDAPLYPVRDRLLNSPPGADLREWAPEKDSLLRRRMPEVSLAAKAEARTVLFEELGLRQENVPLIGIVDRVKVSRSSAEELLAMDLQIVSVDGGPDVDAMASRAPMKVASTQPKTDFERRQRRHRIVAAADFVLTSEAPRPVSSLFPLRYGAAILGRRSGELADRIVDFDVRTKTGSGILYREPGEFVRAFQRAIDIYRNGDETRRALVERCVAIDLSWDTFAARIEEALS